MVKIRFTVAILLVIALALPLAAAAVVREPRAPLLEALAFVPADARRGGLDFVDWAQLKALHDGADITGDSPLRERQRLLLDIAHAEAAPMPFGFDRLPRWSEAWGWDSSDLEWEARVYGEIAVMRFGRHWDARVFRDALTDFGYGVETIPGGTVYHPDPTAEVPWHLRFANMHGLDIHGRVITEPMVQVAVSGDGRTVLFSRSHDAGPRLRAALEARPVRVAASAFGRAAAALGQPVAASILDGREACSERAIGWLEGRAREIAASVAPLHRYDALAAGYTRAQKSALPQGRFVFAYPRSQQARDDLPGRRVLVEEGNPFNDAFSRYEEVAFALADARVVGSRLILDVTPIGGSPVHVLRHVNISPILFATCGSVPALPQA